MTIYARKNKSFNDLPRHGGTGFIKPLENKGLTALKRESCTEVVQKTSRSACPLQGEICK